MHDGMLYDPIQGQGQGHGASEVLKIALFSLISSATYRAGFLTFVLVFVSSDLELGRVPAVSLSRKKVFPISMKFGMYIEVDE